MTDKIYAKGTERNFPQVTKKSSGDIMPQHEVSTSTGKKAPHLHG